MRFIIFDLEATCWKNEHFPEKMETIEIGAVALDEDGEIQDEFDCFVRPVLHPKLSNFCTNLTSITQQNVDGAEIFAVEFARFVAWAQQSGEPLILVSWGGFDPKQFQLECARANIEYPVSFAHHVNIKQRFARAREMEKPVGMARALKMLEISLSGTHHRGIDDARNIAKIARTMLEHLS